ncbi:cell wall-associated NlpC family hydrolase [Streptomyces olivoverticillatus]|uniref:Cell wall-associated NlpC family hydrolase n=1 Tax=Streptomyces olivoverticillatus TaxID=66427 RepID=A0A7W7LNF5_9ACTN|nr:cell wall-associated NlpC family hydrolase [Streptomyces olivoverticillatus]
MASHRRPKQPSRARVTVLTATAAAAVAFSAQAAHAADPKLSKSEAKDKVDKLYEEAEQATEKYNGAKEQHDKLEKQVSALQDKVARGQEELNKLRTGLGLMANSQYRTGSIDPTLQLLLSSDPDSYLEKASTLNQLSAKQADTLRMIAAKQRTLKQEREEASGKLADLESTRKALEDRKGEVQGKLADAQQVLNGFTEQERAEITGADQKGGSSSGKGGGDNGRASRSDARPNIPAGSGRGAAALAYAQSQEGKPYEYGATGMSTWDCSGLTQWAYGQAGVSLPRISQDQANAGTRIYDQSQLQPGDLVIFYGDQHHVGLYAGNGQVFHAPRTGAFVRYEAMSDMPFQFGVRIG